jgi:hypothetical protein
MAQSSSTLLSIANQALIEVGERPITDITSFVALKAFESCRQAVREFAVEADWAFQRESTRPFTNWSSNKASIIGMQRVFSVSYRAGTAAGYIQIPYIEAPVFNQNVPVAGTPECYTLLSDEQFGFYPTPSVADQTNLIAEVSMSLVPPATSTNFFPIPERLMFIIKTRAKYHLALNHLDDKGSAQMYEREYQLAVQQVRNRERNREVNTKNLYRRRA